MHDTPVNTLGSDAYLGRFRNVLKHIEANPEEDLSVEAMSGIAAFSKYHFHRQFTALMGISVFKYVHLVRLRRASYRLAFRDARIIEIALASGYESHEAFSRAFKKTVGQTPSEFREQPEWNAWLATYAHLSELRSQQMKPDIQSEDVQIVDFEETAVAALEHRGDPRLLMSTVGKFIAWRKENNLPPRVSATFNILYDDPAQTPPAEFRFDVCAATPRSVPENDVGVVQKRIPGGRCAKLRHVGSDDTLGSALTYLYSRWLPSSGEELRDFPLYVQRVHFFPDVPEHEAVVDIFLPLK